jgi:hypothetical protein
VEKDLISSRLRERSETSEKESSLIEQLKLQPKEITRPKEESKLNQADISLLKMDYLDVAAFSKRFG